MSAPTLIAAKDVPSSLPILPPRNSVFFPGGVLPLLAELGALTWKES